MRPLRVIGSPYHDGLREVDRGRGPAGLLDAAGDHLAGATTETVPPPDPMLPEAARVFEVLGVLSRRVAAAHADGAFPLVLAGDCNSCLGTVAGSGTTDLGVLWFDAHADFDTPETSRSGSLDAMGLALLTGRGWSTLRRQVAGREPVDERAVVQVAVRDFEPGQRDRLRRSGVRQVSAGHDTADQLGSALDDLRRRVRRLYLHIDLDSLDPSEGTANKYSAPGGLTRTQLLDAVAAAFCRFDVVAAAVTAYDPEADTDGRMARTAAEVIGAVAARGTGQPLAR